MVTNLPVLFPLFKMWLGSFFRSSLRLLSHPGWPNGSQGDKSQEAQVGGGGNDSRRHQGHRTLYPIHHASRGRAGSSILSVRSSQLASPYRTPTRTLDVGAGGSRVYSGAEDNELDHGPFAPRERDWEHEDEAVLNHTDRGGSDGIITRVPPCKIRKDVEVSVEEGRLTSLSSGNFTSVWGPKRKPPGPGLPIDMRTPYLADHLQPVAHGTENWESSHMTRSIG